MLRLRGIALTVAGLAAILVAGGGPKAATAEAAVYTAKRPGFSILLQIQGKRVVGISARYTIHCRAESGGLNNPVRHPMLSFDRRDAFRLGSTGRFRKRFKNVTDQVTLDRGIRGKVRRGTVRGSLIDKRFYSSPFTPQFLQQRPEQRDATNTLRRSPPIQADQRARLGKPDEVPVSRLPLSVSSPPAFPPGIPR